jgi:hypothetical protein
MIFEITATNEVMCTTEWTVEADTADEAENKILNGQGTLVSTSNEDLEPLQVEEVSEQLTLDGFGIQRIS